ncbi:tetratricopeptide repeat protein [Flavobacterium sp. J49]|uniref:tetratricopeptide repeat-containing sensor histidine kinase n=1 Tax=Flavobacterium sp. J49 TaxID=2718534 RepID=UPI001592E100|nr:tetratricopeptide repeat-containing sensor histidine kinase [Flavobacterium sp. J49]MBF6641348.1 tetratricopeptide repeat protein [Flavobacterium sp. J49]NIC02595.1 tetratricopeptide repeat protein [Flavobacterium sp. J49]
MKTKLFFLIILISLFSCSKKDEKESTNLKNERNDSVEKILNLSKSKPSFFEKKKLIDKAYEIVSNGDNSLQSRNYLSKIIFEYYYINDLESVNNTSKYLLKLSKKTNDSINLGVAYRSKAFYFKSKNVLDSSFYYYFKSEKLYQNLNDRLNLANVLLNKGMVQYKGGNNLGAELSLTRAQNLFNELNEQQKLFETLIVLGNVSEELKEFDKSLIYYTKALEKAKELEKESKTHREAICYNNIGFVYEKLNDYNKAIQNFNLGLKDIGIRKDLPDLYANLLDNLAYSKLKTNKTEGLPQMFYTSLKIRDSLNSISNIIVSNIHLSQYYASIGNIKTAEKYAKNALKISRTSKTPIDILLSLQQASDVDISNASNYNKEYVKLSDSLQVIERKSKDRFASIELETEEIKQENQGLAEKNRNLLYIFVVSFILVVLLFVVRAQRARTRELLYKQAQQKANEDIYNLMMSQQAIIDESRSKEKKRLAQDLHDGVLGRMFGLRLNLDSLNSSTEAEAVQKRFELLNELKTIEQDIREISHDLNREKQVLINNFVSIVHNLLEEQKTSFEANVTYTIDENVVWDKIGNAIKINMYRILQEGLQNINKYANANNIFVEIKGDKENVYLKIQDDGIGFDVNRKSKGIGMQNMISRTHDCKGIIDIYSKKDNGTKIVITIPIETKPIIVEQE